MFAPSAMRLRCPTSGLADRGSRCHVLAAVLVVLTTVVSHPRKALNHHVAGESSADVGSIRSPHRAKSAGSLTYLPIASPTSVTRSSTSL